MTVLRDCIDQRLRLWNEVVKQNKELALAHVFVGLELNAILQFFGGEELPTKPEPTTDEQKVADEAIKSFRMGGFGQDSCWYSSSSVVRLSNGRNVRIRLERIEQ